MKSSNQNGVAHTAVVILVVALAAVAGVGYFVFSKNDTKSTSSNSPSTAQTAQNNSSAEEAAVKTAAKEHFALVYAKNNQEAYTVTCQDFKDLTPYDKFLTQLQSGGFYTIDLSAVEYTKVEVRNNQAKISGPVGPLQPNTDLAVSLLKKNNKWCVYGYEAKAA